ncbi:hypothetical protein KQI65_04875 [bacterium]|nr:hypothetical protein [bacterium]
MRLSLITCLALVCSCSAAHASNLPSPPTDGDSLESIVRAIFDPSEVSVSGQFFIAFETGSRGNTPFSDFVINRGYINVSKELLPGFYGRITPDITVDRDGDEEGNLALRLKYCFIKADLPDFTVFTKPAIEFGLIARPWLNFEQKINHYRVQGYMFIESIGIINSADFGTKASTLLGGEIDDEYKKHVSSKYPGRYGSIAVGVFNGGGYHAIERNTNKTIEGRLTLRPLPDFLPGLQISYSGAFGKGNIAEDLDWNMHLGFVSYEHEFFVLTATLFNGSGNSSGNDVTGDGYPMDLNGTSFFAEFKLPSTPISVIGRYDEAEEEFPETSGFYGLGIDNLMSNDRIIAGLAYRISRRNKLLLDYERTTNYRGNVTFEAVTFNVEYTF